MDDHAVFRCLDICPHFPEIFGHNLNYFGADVTSEGTTAFIKPDPSLYGREILVPGDISSAAYFIAAGLLVPNSEILLKNVGINPTRDGILRVCRAMGADFTLLNETTEGEPTADLLIRSSALHGTTIEGAIIPTLIDELPMIAVMAAFAEGTTVTRVMPSEYIPARSTQDFTWADATGEL